MANLLRNSVSYVFYTFYLARVRQKTRIFYHFSVLLLNSFNTFVSYGFLFIFLVVFCIFDLIFKKCFYKHDDSLFMLRSSSPLVVQINHLYFYFLLAIVNYLHVYIDNHYCVFPLKRKTKTISAASTKN